MHRVVSTTAEIKQEDGTRAREVLESLLLQLSNNDCGAHSLYDVLLPNGLLASFSKEMMDKTTKAKRRDLFLLMSGNMDINYSKQW
jgi:hypothetical protein